MNQRKLAAIGLLDDTITAVCKIECECCDKSDSLTLITSDAMDAAEAFYDDGWRVIEEKVLCKKCRRKK